MKPPPSKPGDLSPPTAAGDTQVIDLQDVELVMAAQQMQAEHERSLPPPLPPEVRASHVPVEPRASQLPGSHGPSVHPPAPAARSSAFYVVALLVFLFVGVGGGVFVAMSLRSAPPAAVQAPTAKPQAAVITIPTVEVDDDPDGGR